MTRAIICRKVRGSYRLDRDAWPIAGRYLWAAVVKVDAWGYVRDRERLDYVSFQATGVCELPILDPGQVLELGYKSFRGARGRAEGAHGKGYVLIVQALYGGDSALLSVQDFGQDSLGARVASDALCAALGTPPVTAPEPGPRAKAREERKAARQADGAHKPRRARENGPVASVPPVPTCEPWGDTWESEGDFLDACYG